MKVELQIEKCFSKSLVLECDWELYKLAVFNMVQNAVKFNRRNGHIHITLKIEEEVIGSDGAIL